MKKVTIKQMTLINFKGIKSLTVDFGGLTEIRGANATGKSTIADAFSWALFGKDAAGNSDTKFGIKTNDRDGNVIPKLDHEVAALLDVDGQDTELRRVLSENWVTSRGKAEPELKGNTTAYFYNGVPLKETEYKAKVSAIIDEDLFRMLANPLHFPRQDWQVQRDILLRMAGGITLEEIAEGRAEFSELLSQLSGKSLQEYKAELSARKKKITEALSSIPARIDEVTRATPAAPDYAALEAEKATIGERIEVLETAMQNASEAARAEYETQAEIQRQINAQKGIQQETLFKARQEATKAAYEKNAARNEAESKRNALKKELDNLTATTNREIESQSADVRKNLLQIGNLNRKVEALRSQWEAENKKEYSDSGDNCPTCGQTLPEDRRMEKRSLFEEAKAKELKRITDEGIGLNKTIRALGEENGNMKKGVDEAKAKLEERQAELTAGIQEQDAVISNHPAVETNVEIKGEDLPEWNAAQDEINRLSASLQERPATGDSSTLAAEKKELGERLDAIKRQLSVKSVIEANDKRKAELLKEEKDLAQQKADLEKQEFAADKLVKEQMNEVEQRVNGKFSRVRFKMFSQQLNGGEKPDCILFSTETGAKFMDTNNADKINIGLDIIRALCEFNGVTAPIFIDNAESVNRFAETGSQMIFLRVTEDKELVINNNLNTKTV
jgi:DNA repair exonuclease SbcCD ATPase subunit